LKKEKHNKNDFSGWRKSGIGVGGKLRYQTLNLCQYFSQTASRKTANEEQILTTCLWMAYPKQHV
jgi:hypothetical protein